MSVPICKPGLRLKGQQLALIAARSLRWFSRVNGQGSELHTDSARPEELPTDAIFVVATRIYRVAEHFDQLIFFRRGPTHDELWSHTTGFEQLADNLAAALPPDRAAVIAETTACADRVITVPRQGSLDEALVELLVSWLWTHSGYVHAQDDLVATGYVGVWHWRAIFKQLEIARARSRRRQEAFAREARANVTEIVRVARELGLHPEPAGTGPVQWLAWCPATQHRLMISTSSDEFGCGYCRRRGGVEELRELVAERNDKERKVRERIRGHQQ